MRGKSFFAGPFLSGARCFRPFSGGGGEGSQELLLALGRFGQLEASHFGQIGLGQLSLRREPRLDSVLLLLLRSPSNHPPFFVSGGRQELNFEVMIPDTAWKLLADGTWPRLRVAKGVPEDHLQRLRKAPLDLEAGSGRWSVGIRALGPTSFCLCLRLWVPPRRSSDLQLTERPRSHRRMRSYRK